MVSSFSLNGLSLPVDAAAIARQICADHGLTSTQLYCKWESYALSTGATSDLPTAEDLTNLAAHIRSKPVPTSATKPAPPPNPFYKAAPLPLPVSFDTFFDVADLPRLQKQASNTEPESEHVGAHGPSADAVIADVDAKAKLREAEQPLIATPATSLSALPSQVPDVQYASRTASGRIEASFNRSTPIPPALSPLHLRLVSRNPLLSEARYMNDTLLSRVHAARTRITDLSDAIIRRVQESRPDFAASGPEAFTATGAGIVVLAGRIRGEEEDGGNTLPFSAASVLLESVDGAVVALNLERLRNNNYPLFLTPGMVVVVEGMHRTPLQGAARRVLDVHAIFDNAVPKHVDGELFTSIKLHKHELSCGDNEAMSDVEDAHQDTVPMTASVMVAAAPFTAATNLLYEPLHDLLQQVERTKPHLVILTGPFVDEKHAQISAETAVPFGTIFQEAVIAPIRRTLERMEGMMTHFVLVPSLDDVHQHHVCPQPPFKWPDRGANKHSNIHFHPNPSMIRVSSSNGYHGSIGVTSLPTLREISGCCICWNKPDRMAAIASHMVRQRSMYPCIGGGVVPLDSTLEEALTIHALPSQPSVDLMIVPSRIHAFVKSIDEGVVAVNPGLLCRGSAGGTYAEIGLRLHEQNKERPMQYNEKHTVVNVIRL